MRETLRRILWRAVLCLIVAIIIGAVTAVVCQSGRSRVLAPGEATEAEIQLAIDELRQILREAGRSQDEINRMTHALKCKYLPESTEGCSDEESRQAQEERQVQDHER